MNFFKDKVVWITGASSGIGEALVRELAKHNARIVLSSRNESELKRVLAASGLNEGSALVLPMDLGSVAGFPSLMEKVISKFGTVDILINNGGLSQRAFAKDTPLELDRKIMEVNYFGTVALTKTVLPHMLKKKSGNIVVISSVSGKFGFYLRSAYAASKHALHGFFDSLRMEIHTDNVKVLLVCPGRINTAISINAMTAEGKAHGGKDRANAEGMSAEACAVKILSAITQNREEIYVGHFREGFALWLRRICPALFSRLIKNQKVE